MSFVLSVFPGFGVGGAQARFCAVANHHRQALRHAIVAMNGDLSCRERLDPGLEVCFPELPASDGGPFVLWRELRAVLRKLRPDVLLTHNLGSIDWAVANLSVGVRHVHVEDGFGPEERDRQIFRRVLARRLLLRRASVVLPSKVLLRIARDVWRLPAARLHYVPNGVDVSRFAGGGRAAADGIVVVGTVAALRPEKNISRLLHAVAGVPEVRLVVVGDGPEFSRLTELAETLGIAGRVEFVGHLADPASAYRRMNIFALSSDTEQMPLSVLEAMAAGLPVAATDVGDVREMVAAQGAPFVVARDAAALAGVLQRLAADAGLRTRVGKANRAKAAGEFNQAAMSRVWGELLGLADPAPDLLCMARFARTEP